jgi:hypothetical protein
MLKLFRAAAAALLTLCALTLSAAAFTVEQTQLCMPDIDVYLYEGDSSFSGLTERDVSATLGGAPLGCQSFGRSQQGIYYVYLLDVSASMPDDLFAAAKAAVSDACARLREQDTLTLITFGNDVRLILSGSESAQEARTAIDALVNNDQHTKFYTAMGALVELASATEEMRRVAVVISDGIDSTDAGMTQDQLEETLLRGGVSVSGMCINSSGADVEGFEKLITMSGGELYTFGADDAGDVLTTLLQRLEGGWRLTLTADSNRASGEPTPLSLTIGGDTVELTVTPEDWTPDTTPPRVESAAVNGDGTVTVVFSEPVSGGDQVSAYTLMTGDGQALPLRAAEGTDGLTFTLTPESPLPADRAVVLTVQGLRDLSMENNEMYKYSKDLISAAPASSPAPSAETAAPEEEPLISPTALILIGCALAAVAAAVLGILYLAGKKPESKENRQSKAKKLRPQQEKPDAVKNTATFMFLPKDGENKKDE